MDKPRSYRNDLRRFIFIGSTTFVTGVFLGRFGTDIRCLLGTAVELKNRASLEWDFIRTLFLRFLMEKQRLIVCEIMVLRLVTRSFLRIHKQEHFLATLL